MSTLKVTNIAGLSGSSTDVMQGLAKAWAAWDGTGTVSLFDSFSISSLTDNLTGDYSLTLSSAMNDTNYAVTGASGTTPPYATFLSPHRRADNGNYVAPTTTVIRVNPMPSNSDTANDSDRVNLAVLGDLA